MSAPPVEIARPGRDWITPSSAALPPAARIEVIEVLGASLAEDCRHVDLSVRTRDGPIVAMRFSHDAIAGALAQLTGNAALALEASAAESAAKLSAPMGEWRIAQGDEAAPPTFECRTADGRGVAFAFTYDPITAIPQLQVAVDL